MKILLAVLIFILGVACAPMVMKLFLISKDQKMVLAVESSSDKSPKPENTPTPRPRDSNGRLILDRVAALDALKHFKIEPDTKEFSNLDCFKDTPGHYLYSANIPFIRAAAELGVLEVWKSPPAPPRTDIGFIYCNKPLTEMVKPGPNTEPHNDIDFYVTLPEEGKKYLASENGTLITFAMSTREPFEILGIGEPSPEMGKVISLVKFKLMNIPTPFGKAYDTATK